MGVTTISKEIEFDAGHRVPNHASQCRNAHGHRYRLRVTCSGDIIDVAGAADQGMLVDFGDLKRWMTELVHDVLDHGFIYEASDPVGEALARAIPDQKLIPMWSAPTAENLARWCWEQLAPVIAEHWRDNLALELVELWETPTSLATYRA